MPRKGINIYKRKDGRWEGRYIKGCKSSKVLYGYVYSKSYKAVKEKLLEAKMKALEFNSITKHDTYFMVFQEISAQWLYSMKAKVKESTYVKYSCLLEKHLLPQLGQYKIHELNAFCIDKFTIEKLNNGKLCGDGGLSTKTVRDLLSIIKSILTYANLLPAQLFIQNTSIQKCVYYPKMNKCY